MKRIICLMALLMGFVVLRSTISANAQEVALKTNVAYWLAYGTLNGSVEFALSPRMTADIGGGLNPWKMRNMKRAKHWAVQPELRYWFCEAFTGHYVGAHVHAGQYNIGGLNIPVGRLSAFREHRYEGYFYGAGLSYGYQKILSPRWNLELGLGAGWARTHYRRFPCAYCGSVQASGVYDYFGITRATVSLIYFIK